MLNNTDDGLLIYVPNKLPTIKCYILYQNPPETAYLCALPQTSYNSRLWSYEIKYTHKFKPKAAKFMKIYIFNV